MDWLSKIDWSAIIRAAASSNLGTISLALLVFGIVVIILFRNDSESKSKLIALSLLIIGALGFAAVVGRETVDQVDQNRLEAERSELIEKCKAQAVSVPDSCRAADRSGFESSPSASCELTLTAPEEMFFVDNEVFVVSESYRNISGASAQNSVKPVHFFKYEDIQFPTVFTGRIGCTNARGTGRTCESTATIQATAFPNFCAPVGRELRR